MPRKKKPPSTLLHKQHKSIKGNRIAEIAIGDFHCGNIWGLFYPHSSYDHEPNDVQVFLYRRWRDWFLPAVEKQLDEWKPDVVHAIIGGDNGDVDHKRRSPHEYWTPSENIIVSNLAELLEPIAKMSDYLRFVRGTRSHIGDDGGTDEGVAREFSNTIWERSNRAAPYHYEYKLGNVAIDAQHYGRNRSVSGETNLLNSASQQMIVDRWRAKRTVPYMVWRYHFHWPGLSDIESRPLWAQVPCWQGKAAYIAERDYLSKTSYIGGRMALYEDEDIREAVVIKKKVTV